MNLSEKLLTANFMDIFELIFLSRIIKIAKDYLYIEIFFLFSHFVWCRIFHPVLVDKNWGQENIDDIVWLTSNRSKERTLANLEGLVVVFHDVDFT